MSKVQGRFDYLGGWPGFEPASRCQIEVERDGLHVKSNRGFTIPVAAITASRTASRPSGISPIYPPDALVEVDVTVNGRAFTALFRSVGMTRQKDSFALNSAIITELAHQASTG